ncbi:MAG: minichromosome maintenance protein MCM [Candidatus Thermoplasmatota archaeon]|nr:minichromosome maintenance protein MCM [Candidatus Thermoplasmatota archaeon]
MDREELKQKWIEFMEEYGYDSQAIAVADNFPQERSLFVEWEDIDEWDPIFLGFILENPEYAFRVAEDVLLDFVPADKREEIMRHYIKIHVRLKGAPKDKFILIRDIRHEHVGKYLTVNGIIKRASDIRPRLLMGVFRCSRCGAFFNMEQEGSRFVEPVVCDQEQGGCGKNINQTSFKLLPERSKYVDSQNLEIQEELEGLRGGAQPKSIKIWLEDDVVGMVFPGDRVRLNGVLVATQKKKGAEKLTEFDIHLLGNYIGREKTDYEAMVPDESDLEDFERLRRDPETSNRIRDSIAPGIYGYTEVKEALALQLFGGVEKVMTGQPRRRGDIHVLLVGDPGTAKSQLLRQMAEIAPRGIYASGKSASSAGLTAAAVKDDGNDGRWTLEAGVLVLADRGTACIDELDKMSTQDRSSMHEAMEQQTVTVAKAGITATLRSRCTLLGAANPKKGRFGEYDPIVDQIDMPPTLLSRFDLIFPMTDKPGDKDEAVANHILTVHEHGSATIQNAKGIFSSELDPDVLIRGEEIIKPPIGTELLRKYIAYAKSSCFPALTPEAKKKISDFYLEIRKMGEAPGSPVPITARQLEAIVRLSEASAKMRLSDVVKSEDVDKATKIMSFYLKKLTSEEGIWDIDRVSSPYSSRQRTTATDLRNIISVMVNENKDGVSIEDIVSQAGEKGYSEEEIKSVINKLHETGELYKARGKYRIVGGR